QERVFPAPRDVVTQAARTFMAESLGWQITDTADGFTAQGYSFSHRAIANLQFQSAAGGTKVAIELLVERTGWRGYMLFDVAGYSWNVGPYRVGADLNIRSICRVED